MSLALWKGQSWLISLDECAAVVFEESNDPISPERLKRLIPQASGAIETFCLRKFVPYVGTRQFDHPEDVRSLRLDEDLLSITTLTHENGGDTLASTLWYLWPPNEPPYSRVELYRDQGEVFSYSGTPQLSVSVLGQWGWGNTTYDSTANVDTGGIDSSASALPVTNPNVFSVGQHLLIESEQLFVREVQESQLLVARGVNGTTAAAHVATTDISIYAVEPEIEYACGLMVARMDKRHAAAGADLAGTPDSGYRVVGQWPKDVLDIIKKFKRVEPLGSGSEGADWYWRDNWRQVY
jgi:hypothetical protein